MINPVAFQFGLFSIHWYGIIIDTAFIIGTVLAYYNAKKSDINPEHILNLLILIIPASIIGARLYYVLFNLDYYLTDPLEIIATWHGGLAIHGGLAGVPRHRDDASHLQHRQRPHRRHPWIRHRETPGGANEGSQPDHVGTGRVVRGQYRDLRASLTWAPAWYSPFWPQLPGHK